MMICPKPTLPAHLFFLVILFIHMASFKLSYCIIRNNILCPEIEKQALLSFKQSLSHPSNQLLSSWNNGSEVNCCKWKGVVCNNVTGHIHELHLQNQDYPDSSSGLSGKINPSLLSLKQLRYLDLSQNKFGERIPSFIGSLRSLEYLNLSNAGFHGLIPHNIGNLSNLRTLVLDQDQFLEVDGLEWLAGLSQLEHLNMNHVNLSKAPANWAQVINTLPSLVELHFAYCNLHLFTDSLMNVSSSLAILDLSSNRDFLSFFVLRWIFQLSNLISLDLSWNWFEGPIPSISNTTKLKHIDLSENYFNSTIPDWLYSCTDLQFLSLTSNFLDGTFSNAVANLSSLNTLELAGNHLSGRIPREIANLCNMQMLDLSGNELQGEISDSFGNMSNCFLDSLQVLDLSHNQLSGHLTDQFVEFKTLTALFLSNNLLSGVIPTNLGKLLSLRDLDLSDNKLEGFVTERHFANLTKLTRVLASHNHQLTLKVNPNWIPPFKLDSLQLASWYLGTKNIPSWLHTQKNLKELDLSCTGISGLVPGWIWGIRQLNLSNNYLHGKIPDKFGNNTAVYLSSNQFSGSLPQVGDGVMALDLSNNSFSGGLSHFLCENITNELEILYLGGNQLTGELPDCFMKWPKLKVLNLGNNNLSGSIPNSIGFLSDLQSLDLQGNKLSGQIPFSMHNCTGLMKIDLAHNNIEGNIPKWMGMSLYYLTILILRANKLSGQISSNVCQLKYLQILDLSYNKFSGKIPRCVDNFTAMATKNSVSQFYSDLYYESDGITIWTFIESAIATTKGQDSQYSTILGLVTNMDLSNNNLSGDIPKGLTSLVELGSLNLSGNHLTGLIPSNIGDMKKLESLDFSKNTLSGGIPNSFTTMSFLSYLNLSYNNLTGKIPESTQISGFDASNFIGNQLCGPPLTRNCSNGDKVPAPVNKEEHEGGKSKIDWFYVFVSSGFAVGFSVVCSTLIFNKSWRDAYFGFVEDIWNKLYVFFYVKWRMFVGR